MGEKRRFAPYSSWIPFGAGAGILEQSTGVRNREGTELSYTGPPACVAWRRAATITLFLAPKYCSKILSTGEQLSVRKTVDR
jgi:hypothetical protein